ncbi:MAG TPA: DUF504 domain-containing protein [Sandaracinaceae bacterium LLY-WYZ-13_1]|nr:DUF504 domain-containing protein [Sandaracinaceae bacterium LLY-WYZ-13_1]
MTPSHEIYHRIVWDPSLDPARFSIGIDVHADAPVEVPFEAFEPDGEIPWHRVIYFRADDAIVWDRRTTTDRLDDAAAT